LVWDIQQLSGLRPMVEAVDPPDRRRILLGEIDRFEDSVASALGKLRPVIDAVHAAGGIYIADEVQPGFARTGESMWGFQRHGIAPDLAVMGKPMGNGMPIAGVAARAELLTEFGQKIRYFNTFGGNSISVAAGLGRPGRDRR
jgi:Aminotransferase class-III